MYSQKSPQYKDLRLGTTNVGRDGCVVTTVSSITQIPLEKILKSKAIMRNGEIDLQALGKEFGFSISRSTRPPSRWCMAKTYLLRPHYFAYNPQTKEMIDPLDYPAGRRPNIYRIYEYITFSNTKLNFSEPAEISIENKINNLEKRYSREKNPPLKSRIIEAIASLRRTLSRRNNR